MEHPWKLVNVSIERSPLFPNPFTCIGDMAGTLSRELVIRSPWGVWGQWLRETWDYLELAVNFDPVMILWATLICTVLTVLRAVLNRNVLTPLGKRYKLTDEAVEKLPESLWKFSVYLITWCWSAYITYDLDLMGDLASHWTTWYPGRSVETSVYWLFTFEIGFYIHYTYGMLFLEARRKDFTVLMLHHVLTVALILGCYCVRFHIIGVVLIFIHDIGDVFLEGSKSILYFKEQDGKTVKWVETCANVGFLMFAAEYFLFRIYWFITKALYSTLHICLVVYPNGPFYLPFNFMLLALLSMQIFWFSMIVKLLVKVLFLREDLEDVRDIKKEEGESGGMANGGAKTANPNISSTAHEDKKKK